MNYNFHVPALSWLAFSGSVCSHWLSNSDQVSWTDAEPNRVLEIPHRGVQPQQPGAAAARLSCWEIMLLLKQVAKAMGPATATGLYDFMQATNRNYDLHRLHTFNILLQGWAVNTAPFPARTAVENCVHLLERYNPRR